MTEPIRPPTLTLLSKGLLSKWGFNDGDAPDQDDPPAARLSLLAPA